MSPRRPLYNLSLISHPDHPDTHIRHYLARLTMPYSELALDHPGLRYLARRMKEERKSAPALMYRNQIVPVATRFRVHQALLDWRLIETTKEE